MPFINITHKKQTRANDCWYACIQMLKTWRAGGVKTKPTGAGVRHHRNLGPFSKVWGNPLGGDDADFQAILTQNGLQDLMADQMVYTHNLAALQDICDRFGPYIVGGEFGQALRVRGTSHWLMKRMGHYIVVVGTDQGSGNVIVHDPWRSHRTEMSVARFRRLMWRGDGRTLIACA